VVEELRGKWVDVVKKMGKQMDNFVSQGEARERSTRSCSARIIRFNETEGETTQQLLDKVNSQVLPRQMKLAIKVVAAMRQPFSRRAEMLQPHFEEGVRSPLTLPKMGLGSPPRLRKTQSMIVRVKTPCIKAFFIPLKRS